jgi:hypothetical protein
MAFHVNDHFQKNFANDAPNDGNLPQRADVAVQ